MPRGAVMAFELPIQQAENMFPDYEFLSAFPPSLQKAAFEVRDATGRRLCLKVIAPDYRFDRLEREILALQSLTHPNVARLVEYTFSTKEGEQRHYVIEEFVDGGDLFERLEKGQKWDLGRVALVFGQIAAGLSAIHDLRIVHRDLKPSNIRIRSDDTPAIIDLGLARHLDLSDITRTEEGAAIGTPEYFAPEQFSGTKHDIDHRTDLFALGIMIYEASVGRHPFVESGMDYADLKRRVLESDDHLADKDFRSLPDSWQLLIKRLLGRSRVKRPTSAGQVVRILARMGNKQ